MLSRAGLPRQVLLHGFGGKRGSVQCVCMHPAALTAVTPPSGTGGHFRALYIAKVRLALAVNLRERCCR